MRHQGHISEWNIPLLKMVLRSHNNVIVIPLTAAAFVVVVALVVVVVLFLYGEDLLNNKTLLIQAALVAQPHTSSPINRGHPLMRSSEVSTTNSTLVMPAAHLPNPLHTGDAIMRWGLISAAL